MEAQRRNALPLKRLLLALALAASGGCGGAGEAKDTTSLRFEIGSNPGDLSARAQLAQRADSEGRPGEAIRELLFVKERRDLGEQESALLAKLLDCRGRQRLELGDSGALADFQTAASLGGLVDSKKMSDAYALCAVTALRHSSEFRQAEAKACLEALDEKHIYRRWDKVEGLSLSNLERLWSWFATAGAKRHALKIAQAWVNAGGREAVHLAQWQSLHRWWFGKSRPLLPASAASALGNASTALERFTASSDREFADQSVTIKSLAAQWGAAGWTTTVNEIVGGYRIDPALADRRARRFADSSAYGLREAAFLAELFYRLGDRGRARDWAQELADRAPKLPAAQEAAGHAHAVSGQVERAGIFYTVAAAASGDGGATWGRAMRAYLAGEEPLAAIAAGRRAIGLTARGWDMLLLFEVALAQRKLGRDDQATKTLEALWARFPVADQAAAKVLAAANENGPQSSFSLLGPIRQRLGFPRLPTAKYPTAK